jgi:ABC-type Fe3+-siderophore transport system permease subunit
MQEELLDKLPAVIASGFVLILVADLIGNHINFDNRLYNAAITCVVWGVLFFVLNYAYAWWSESGIVESDNLKIYTLGGALLAFAADYIGNSISFKRPFVNAFVTAFIWAVAFGLGAWWFIRTYVPA